MHSKISFITTLLSRTTRGTYCRFLICSIVLVVFLVEHNAGHKTTRRNEPLNNKPKSDASSARILDRLPQYIKDVYTSTTGTGDLTKASLPFDSNVIRSFSNEDPVHQMHFSYDLSELDKEEDVLQAQFHLFKILHRPAGHDKPLPPILIQVYQVLDIRDMTSSKNLLLLDEKKININGWLYFNVTNAVLPRHKKKVNKVDFLVRAKTMSGQFISHPTVRFAQRNVHHDSQQPVLIVFGKDIRNQVPSFISPDVKELSKIKEDNETRRERTPLSGRSKRSAEQLCSRQSMIVDIANSFLDIILPEKYDVYRCSGECHLPNATTNHAMIQNLVSLVDTGIDQPCCVPDKLKPLTVITSKTSGVHLVQQYKDMVVESCGCH